MMLYFVLVSAVFGASIPPQPGALPSECLQKCFKDNSMLSTAQDLNNFRNISTQIEDFCKVNSEVLKCGRECSDADIKELEEKTNDSSFICMDKVEEFRLVQECLSSTVDPMDSCLEECSLSMATLRFDSSPEALVNPTSAPEAFKEHCVNQMCALRCSVGSFEGKCAGAGQLLRDLATHQVERGVNMMHSIMESDNEDEKKTIAAYASKMPQECVAFKNTELFKEQTKNFHKTEANSDVKGTTEGLLKKDSGEIPSDEESTTVAMMEETTLEFEPQNDPDVPSGPPDTNATVEPMRIVEGLTEEDERIIDMAGREKTTTLPMVEGEASVGSGENDEEATTTISEEVTEPVDITGLGTTTEVMETTVETSTDPVIVIDDGKSETTQEPVSSATTTVIGAMFTLFLAAFCL